MLRQHMANMYQAWMTRKAPPLPPPSFLDATLTQTLVIVPDDSPYTLDPPAYHSFPNHPGSSITHPPITFPQIAFLSYSLSPRSQLLNNLPFIDPTMNTHSKLMTPNITPQRLSTRFLTHTIKTLGMILMLKIKRSQEKKGKMRYPES